MHLTGLFNISLNCNEGAKVVTDENGRFITYRFYFTGTYQSKFKHNPLSLSQTLSVTLCLSHFLSLSLCLSVCLSLSLSLSLSLLLSPTVSVSLCLSLPLLLTSSLSLFLSLSLSGTRICLGDFCRHVPNPESAKGLLNMLDLKLLSLEEIDDMKVIAKKIQASGPLFFYFFIPFLITFLFRFFY